MPAFTVVAWRVGFSCPECMGPVPLNAIAETVQCAHCMSNVAARPQLDSLSTDFDRWGPPEKWRSGELHANVNVGNGTRTEADVRVAVCRACQVPIDGDDVAAALATSTGVACRGCGQVTAVRLADALVRYVLSSARLVLGEAPAVAGPPTAVQAVLCACLDCGAGLSVDGTQRIVVCTYCNSSNFISDALWLRMHPAHKKQWI